MEDHRKGKSPPAGIRCIDHSAGPSSASKRGSIHISDRPDSIPEGDVVGISEGCHREFLESAPVIACRLMPTGETLYVNNHVEVATGYDPQELNGRNWWDVFCPGELQCQVGALSSQLAKGDVRHLEIQMVDKKGRTRVISWDWFRISDKNTRVSGEIGGIGRDVTAHKRREALSKGAERYWDLLNNASLGVFWARPGDGKLLECNEQFARIAGYDSREECLAEYVLTAITEPGESASSEVQLQHKGGSAVWVRCSTRFNPEMGYIEGVLTDITEEKRSAEAVRDSELRYRRLAENIADVIWTADMNLQTTFVSPSITLQRGYTVEEAMAQTLEEKMPPASLEIARRALAEELTLEKDSNGDRGRWRTIELELNCKDGARMWAEINISFLRNSKGERTAILGVTRDITERKRSEEELRKAHSETALLLASIPSIFVHVNGSMCITQWNGMAEQILGVAARDATGRHLEDCGIQWDWEIVRKGIAEFNAENRTIRLDDVPFKRTNGENGLLGLTISPVAGHNCTLSGFTLLGADITERRLADEMLKRSQDSLAEAQRIARLGNWDWNIVTNELFWSDEIFRIFGLKPQEFGATYEGFLNTVHPDDRERVQKAVDKALYKNKPYSIDHRVVLPDGEVRIVHEHAEVTFNTSGDPIRMVGTVQDITESRRAKEALQRSERELTIMNRIANVFLTAPEDEVYDRVLQIVLGATYSIHGFFGYVNETGAIVYAGMSPGSWERREVPNKRVVFSPEALGGMWERAMLEKKTRYSNKPFTVPRGHVPIRRAMTVPIVHKGSLIGAITIANKPADYGEGDRQLLENITRYIAPILDARLERDSQDRARRQMQAEKDEMQIQLLHAQKLESIGRLAAGIAHEINTPTQYVGDNASFLQESFGNLLKILDKYGELRKMAKAGDISPEFLNEIQELAADIDLEFLSAEIPKAIDQSLDGIDRISKIVSAMKEFSHPGTGEKDPADLNKAIESTITVSRNEWKYVADMVTDLDPSLPPVPCLEGEFKQVILNLITNAAHAIAAVVGDGSEGKGSITVTTLNGGDWVEIRVADTGMGIPESVRSRVFEPFFTTKEIGKGTGQGLAIARSAIVGKHGGTITFETETGHGTTFIIRLPLGRA